MPIPTEPPRPPRTDALLDDVFAARKNIARPAPPFPARPDAPFPTAPQMPISDVSPGIQRFADQVERMEIRGTDRHAAFREFAGLYELDLLSLGDCRRLVELGADPNSFGLGPDQQQQLGRTEGPQVDAEGARRAVGAFFNNGILHLDLEQLTRESREDRNHALDAELAQAMQEAGPRAERRRILYQLSLEVLSLARPQTREALGPNITADQIMPALYVLNALLRTEPPQATDPEFFRVLEGLNDAYLQSLILDPSGEASLAFSQSHNAEQIRDRATHVNTSPVEISPQLRELADIVAGEALFWIGEASQGPTTDRNRLPTPPPPAPPPAGSPSRADRFTKFLNDKVGSRLQRLSQVGNERRPQRRPVAPDIALFGAITQLDSAFGREINADPQAIVDAFRQLPEAVRAARIRDLNITVDLATNHRPAVIASSHGELRDEQLRQIAEHYARILSLVAPRPDVSATGGVAPRPPS